ncbi:hypothetical protein Tco_1266589, partial [Tanacetum coccineum]
PKEEVPEPQQKNTYPSHPVTDPNRLKVVQDLDGENFQFLQQQLLVWSPSEKRVCEEFPPLLFLFFCQTFQSLRRHAFHSKFVDKKCKSFSSQSRGKDICQLIFCSSEV